MCKMADGKFCINNTNYNNVVGFKILKCILCHVIYTKYVFNILNYFIYNTH